MASFVLTDIDWDQTGFGEGQAVPELAAQLPKTARAVRRIPGPDRDDYFVGILEQPIIYHPAPGFDWSRTQPDDVGTDDAGRFVRIWALVVATPRVGDRMHAGMKAQPVFVAYVIDTTMLRDEHLDFGKCDVIGWGFINDGAT